MKKILVILAAAAALVISCGKDPEPGTETPVDPPVDTTTAAIPADLRVMYFNIRTSWSSADAALGFDWPRRKAGCWAMLNEYMPDVVGFNEMKPDQLADMKADMAAYTCFEGAYDDSDCNYIFYRADVVEPVEGCCGKFWLSPTPDVQSLVWSGGETNYRTCIYTRFRHLVSGNEFWFFLTHPSSGLSYDVMRSGQLIKKRMNAIVTDDTAVFIGGDMNCREDMPGMTFLKSYMAMVRDIAPVTDHKGTYNDWGEHSSVIDHILAKGRVAVKKFETVDKRFECESPYISDHYPVCADVTIGVEKPLTVPAVTILTPPEVNITPSDGMSSGSFSTMPAVYMDTPDSFREIQGMKLGTSDKTGSFSFLPPAIGDITLSFSAFGWNKAQPKLEITVSGGGTIDGKTSVTVAPRGRVSGSYICVGITEADLYTFDIKGATASTIISLKAVLANQGDVTEPGATLEYRVAVFGLNVSGGTPRTGSGSVPAPLNPRDDYGGLFK